MRKRPSRGRASERNGAAVRPGPRLESLLEKRIQALSAWLSRHAAFCTQEQAHLDEGSRERAYWHYGYLVALGDVRAVLRNGRRLPPRTRKES